MMLAFVIEILFVFVIMKCIESIGFVNCCLIYAVFSAISATLTGLGLGAIISAFLSGLLSGAIAFLMAKFFLFLIRVLGGLAYIIIIAIVILLLLAVIL